MQVHWEADYHCAQREEVHSGPDSRWTGDNHCLQSSRKRRCWPGHTLCLPNMPQAIHLHQQRKASTGRQAGRQACMCWAIWLQITLRLPHIQSLSWTTEGFSMTRLKRAERDRESSDQRDVGKVGSITFSFQGITHCYKEQGSYATNNSSKGWDLKEAIYM